MRLLQSHFVRIFARLALVPLAIALQAHSQAPGNDEVQAVDKNAAAAIGTYVGSFGPHKITVSVEKIVGRTVMGYSIVTGNERAFSGAWETVSDGIAFIAKEPGDHAEDGVFALTFSAREKTLTGRWDAADKKLPSTELSLKMRQFKYDKKVGGYPQASTKILKEADVENMRPAELRLMRNEIYARHGYSFTIKDMQEHFAAQDWYMPVVLDVKTQLTPLELKNAELIKRYEKYGAEYYDRFGR